MKVVPLLFFLLAASIQGGFAALDNDNPLTNPDLPPKVRAHLESRILEWLCPRIKMTASNYIRSRLYPLSGSLSGRLSGISSFPAPRTRGFSDITYMGPPLYLSLPFFFDRPKLQSWLEQLTPAQKQRLDNALMASIVAYLKTHPNAFMVVCFIDNTTQNLGGGDYIYPQGGVYTLNGDAGDTVTFPSNQGGIPASPNFFCEPYDTWYQPNYMNPFYFICKGGYTAMWFDATFFWAISSVTYSHGGKQIVLTQKNPVFWSN